MNASFRTTKTETGFTWEVYQVLSSTTPFENGTFAKFITIKSGKSSTRQKALGIAKKWTLYFRKGGEK